MDDYLPRSVTVIQSPWRQIPGYVGTRPRDSGTWQSRNDPQAGLICHLRGTKIVIAACGWPGRYLLLHITGRAPPNPIMIIWQHRLIGAATSDQRTDHSSAGIGDQVTLQRRGHGTSGISCCISWL